MAKRVGFARLTKKQRSELGRRAGQVKVPKGFSMMEPKRRKEIARQGAIAMWAKRRANKKEEK